MSLLNAMLGSVLSNLSSSPAGTPGLLDAISGLLDKNGELGGLEGLAAKFGQAGLGDIVSSWIGQGDNLPISADQLSGVLGSTALSGITHRLGMDPAQAADTLSRVLPGLIDKLTPNGNTEGVDASSLSQLGGSELMDLLGGLLKR